MLVEVRSQSENNGKWKRESGAVEGGRVWVAFIGLSNVEMWRWRGGSAVDSGRHFNVSIMQWRRAGRRGNDGVGCCHKGKKRRRRACLDGDAARHGGTWPVGRQ
jgi:hypothetical protein